MAGWSGDVTVKGGKAAYSIRLYVVETSYSVENNTSDVTWWLDMYSTNSYYSSTSVSGRYTAVINDTTVYNSVKTWSVGGNSGTRIADGTMTISHDADGSKSFSVSASYNTTVDYGVYTPWSGSLSGSMSLTTIPRATAVSLDLSNGTVMGNTITIKGTPASSSFNHKIYYQLNSGAEVHIADVSSGNVNKSWTIPTSLADSVTTSNSASIAINLKTYNGSTHIGTKSTSFTTTVPSTYVPTIDSVTIADTNTALADKFGAFIQSQSALKITIGASGSHGSTIKSITGSVDGSTYTASSGVITTKKINSSGAVSLVVSATDSRGNTTSVTKSIDVTVYSTPTMSGLSVVRANSDYEVDEVDGTYALFGYSYNVTSLDSKNTFTFKIQYKPKSSSSWTDVTSITSGYSMTNGTFKGGNILESTTNYDVRFGIKDYFSSDYVYLQTSVSETYTLMNYGSKGKAVAFFGQSSDGEDEIEVKGALRTYEFGASYYWAGSTSTENYDNYIKLLEFEILLTYTDMPITFRFNGRGQQAETVVTAVFKNENTKDPELTSFTFIGAVSSCYLAKEDTSKWGLYVLKSCTREWITFNSYTCAKNRFKVTLTNSESSVVASLPTPYYTAMDYYVNKIYPVGSIYITVNSTNPSTWMGGTWTQFAQGRTLVGVGGGTDSNGTYWEFNAGAYGGEYTHLLTSDEMPSHNHWLGDANERAWAWSWGGSGKTVFSNNTDAASGNGESSHNRPNTKQGDWFKTTYTGGNGKHNNCQPYAVTYIWKRDA